MIIVKLIIVFCCVNVLSASPNDFCEICVNHTLCKYKAQGPGPSCKSYDSSAKLKGRDIKQLVNRINERRNFVAMGYSKILPHAANMKKIRWSNELASFAQRWADQCDPAIQPDREDQCRDLENLTVGQNVGSVLGPSPGLSVKGYIEMWFIQVLNYEGSVTYYNKSRDHKASYLTQLLWATTELVGCGKVKFYVDERNVMLERLVCNFAPKGNIHGKPVYSIGYPGTQCTTGMVPDYQYKGLCSYGDGAIRDKHAKLATEDHPMNGLLRILNLSNDSVKLAIDPIRNNLRQSSVNLNSRNQRRNQKTRHILANKSNNYAAVKRIPQFRKQMVGNTFMNISGNNNEYLYQHDRGHSHLYHGHEPPQRNYDTTILLNTNRDFRRYDDTTEPVNSYAHTSFRRFNQYAQCTRRIRPIQENCALNQCTTAAPNCYQQTTMCPFTCTEISCTQPAEDHTCVTPYIPPLPDPCACTQPPCHATSTNCNYNTNCPCRAACSSNTCCLTTICPGPRRQNNDLNDYRRTDSLQYYEMIPNVIVRSGDRKIPLENLTPKDTSFYSDNNKSYKVMNDEKDFDQIHKSPPDHSKYKSQDRDYMYHSSNSGLRKKRQPEDPVKPFWQIDNLNRQKPPQLKSMRFTTLQNRKARKYIDSTKLLTSTEPITLKLADYADYQPEHITEKYLSFNELMHLRKISDGFSHYDFRRNQKGAQHDKNQGKSTNKNPGKKENDSNKDKEKHANKDTEKKDTNKDMEKKEKDTNKDKEKDANKDSEKKDTNKNKENHSNKDPEKKEKDKNKEKDANQDLEIKKSNEQLPPAKPLFERINYCTRKLTCTWTAYTSQGENGDNEGNRGPVFGPEIGSRTPPGYVEGCTRTSTCTRDFMDRNKITTLPDSEKDSSESPPQDEDYCERRSLNIQRRHSDIKKPFVYLEI